MKHSILGSRARTLTPLRLFAVSLIAAVLLLGVVLVSPAQAVSYSAEEIAFVEMLNDYRASNGLDALLVSDLISEACDRHGSDMGKYGFFDHYTTGGSDWFEIGSSPWVRMAASGYDFNTYKGENIAAGYGTAAEVFTGWKNSSGHNANMLGANFEVLGVSVVKVIGSKYSYYWTTDFGGYDGRHGSQHRLGRPAGHDHHRGAHHDYHQESHDYHVGHDHHHGLRPADHDHHVFDNDHEQTDHDHHEQADHDHHEQADHYDDRGQGDELLRCQQLHGLRGRDQASCWGRDHIGLSGRLLRPLQQGHPAAVRQDDRPGSGL